MPDDETTDQQDPGATPTASRGETPSTSATDATSSGATTETGTNNEGLEALRTRLSAVNAESAERRHQIKELEEQLANIKKDFSETSQARPKLSEKLDRVQSNREALATAHEKATEALGVLVKSMAKNLPEATRSLLDKLDPLSQAEWLAENAPTGSRNVSGSAGNTAITPRRQDEEEMEAVKQKYNIPSY